MLARSAACMAPAIASSGDDSRRVVGDRRAIELAGVAARRVIGVPAGKTVSMCALKRDERRLGIAARPDAEDVPQLIAMHIGEAQRG